MELFEEAVAALSAGHPGDERGRMLRSMGVKTGGKFYAFATEADVVIAAAARRPGNPVRRAVGAAPAGSSPPRR
ncbi:hypothetical protein ACFW6F_30575 [Streptomyces sp. NPDC058746]|uniref:hypothetical protein n=1 Tax=Streptomyces sp. NPDC058746 TaxID=3346622 RepID=UPI0036A0B2F3